MPDARTLNANYFESQWAAGSRLKQRFQFNLELARKDVLYVLDKLSIGRANKTILDVGFGNGMLAFLFDPSCTLCGSELSPTAIAKANELARRKGYRKVDLKIPSESEPFPFEAGSFDVVIASHVVEHVADDIDFMRAMLRMTKPGGHLVILVPLDFPFSGVVSEQQLINPEHLSSGHYHVRWYNFESFLHRLGALDGECVLSLADGLAWDWKSSFDERRRRMSAGRAGMVLDRVLAAALNIPLSLSPRWCLAALDRMLERRGWRPRQGVFVLKPRSASVFGTGVSR
ncbi:MAG: class I SAM-dependent methyltransferase [Bryobacteraceae bacterium]|jgi:SAM-dependent methyltransferase